MRTSGVWNPPCGLVARHDVDVDRDRHGLLGEVGNGEDDPDGRENIGRRTVELLELRSMLCREHDIGLTALYNAVDDGAFTALRDAHRSLDLAVVSAYDWPSGLLDDVRARNRRLFDLNAAVLAGAVEYSPF